ncbi:MAG: hypothetical protein ACTSV7_06665 [Candidatus Baldrarchaeia archaeon]
MATQIEMVKVRATIEIGDAFRVATPFIQSFNVTKTRGQISTFSASLKVSGAGSKIVGENIVIYAGEKNNEIKIFTGIVRRASITPCFDDPSYVIMNMSGNDVLSLLQGKQYTRRCKATAASWVTIQSVSRKGLKSGRFKAKNEEVIQMSDAELSENRDLVKTIGVGKVDPWRGPDALSRGERKSGNVSFVVEHVEPAGS